MLKLLKILVMLLVADVVAYFCLGKIGNEDDPKNYVVLNPYALPELFDKALYNLAECNKLVSFFGLGIPFVSFGMTSVLVACIGYGVVCSIVRGCRA